MTYASGRYVLLAATAFTALGCANHSQPAAKVPADPWSLSCLDPASGNSAYLTNGIIGLRIQRNGAGADAPLLMVGQYDAKENIESLPSPLRASWKGFDPRSARDYRQTLDMRTGILTTSWTQTGYSVRTQTALAPHEAVVATRWDIFTNSQTDVDLDESKLGLTPVFLPDASAADVKVFALNLSPDLKVHTAVRLPHNSGFGCDDLHVMGSVGPRRQVTLEQVWDLDPESFQPLTGATFEKVRNASAAAWANRWKTDIVIDGPPEDQQAIHSWLFYLRAGLGQGLGPDFSPMGLSSPLYKGHVFWDADIWMFPALAFVDPQGVQGIADYRLNMLPQAVLNADGGGARYPWESAGSGKELAPAAFRDALHITGDVAFMLQQAAALGLVGTHDAHLALQGANQFFHARATNGGKFLHVKGVRGPDEYHQGDDDLYTNALAQWQQDRVRSKSEPYFLPHDAAGLLGFANDPVRAYGQADAILAIYPLQNAEAEKEASAMMQRFPPRTSKSSPAMTDSVKALIRARIGDSETAYRDWESSWRDFSSLPFDLFSEERRKDRTYFQTGAAGCLQTVLYGFLGFRIDWRKHEQAVWETPLKDGAWLSVMPHLPNAWKRVTFRNFVVLGRHLTLTETHVRTTVTQGDFH